MDASATIRLPAVPLSHRKGQTIETTTDRQQAGEAGLTDEELMMQLCAGTREALAVLFRRYARLVRTISSRILRDSSEADDVVQEVFLFIHRKCGTFNSSKSSARSWIVQAAYHRAIDRRRYLQSRHFYTRVELNTATDILDPCSERWDGTDPFCHLVGKATIGGLLAILTEDQRNTLSLHFVEGFTFAEIAAKLDQSLGNIRNHYYRGLERLRKQMFSDKLPGRNGYGRK